MLKTILCAAGLAMTLWGCQSSSSAEKAITKTKDTAVSYFDPPQTLDPAQAKRLHDEVAYFVERHLSPRVFNGGILVAKNGVPIYERYTGFADFRTKDSMTAETPMQVASTGKTLTAAAVLKLVQEGKIGLEDPVSKYFPGLPYPGVTVKMLLNHRSGLPNYLNYMENMGWPRRQPASNEDVIRTLIEWHPPQAYNPGKRFNYCNTNYVLLASIIEKVSGQSYPKYMQEHFFTPLGMKNSFVRLPQDSARVVISYQANGAPWTLDFSDGPYGDKNIYSTPRDLLKWDQALYAGRLIRPAMLDSAFTPYSNERPGIKNYGLGWHLLMLPNNKKVIFHNGKWHGFNAAFARLTDERITIIMTCNKINMAVYGLSKKMYQLFGPYDGKGDTGGED